MSIEVAVVEDIDEIRLALVAILRGSEGFGCPCAFGNGEDAIRQIPEIKPDVVLMDIHLPGLSGPEAVRILKRQCPDIRFIMLTVYEDDDHIFEALRAGATGYLLKKTRPAKILEAIQDTVNGGSPMSGQIARRVVMAFHSPYPTSATDENLTPREHEILRHLAKGYRYKEIADVLYLSVETVRTHIRHIYEKLQVRSRTEALLKMPPRL